MSTAMAHAMRDAMMSAGGPRYPDTIFNAGGEAYDRERMVLEVSEALQRDGVPETERDLYRQQALAGDFEHCVKVTSTWVTIEQ